MTTTASSWSPNQSPPSSTSVSVNKPELGDGPNSTLEQRHDIIRSLVMAALALSDTYAAIAAERQTKT